MKFFQRYLGPILSTILINYMCLFPDKIINKIPSIMKIFIRDKGKNLHSYKDFMPAIPKDPLAIWKLSQLEYSLKETEIKYANNLQKKEEFTEKILKEAKELAGTGQMNSEILHKIPEFLEEIGKNTAVSRVKGFFTFVNVIWTIAILGIFISIGPALLYILPYILIPFKELLMKLLLEVIFPFIIFLYKIGILEFFGYLISISLIADGMKVNKEWGFFISLTGVVLLISLYFYSITKYHMFHDFEIEGNENIILGTLITLTLFGLSIIFNSIALSFSATVVFYYFIGFYTGSFGLCYVIGFSTNKEMYRVVTTSFFLLVFYIGLKYLNVNIKVIELYRCPIQIFGAMTYFLGLLIIASSYSYNSCLSYVRAQLLYIGSLLLVLFCGNIFNLPSLTNTTYVFGALYLMEKNVELFSVITGSEWLIILTTSLFLWRFSLYLHRHSEIIVSIFNGKF